MLWEKPKEALVASFKSIQDKFSKYAMQHSIYSGSTACVALISKDKYILANVGDSRAVVSRLGEFPKLQLTINQLYKQKWREYTELGVG